MVSKYEVIGKNISKGQYTATMVELSPILENAVYFLSKGSSMPEKGYGGSKSSSCQSSSPCRAVSLESKLKK